jgi:hypothetical protein
MNTARNLSMIAALLTVAVLAGAYWYFSEGETVAVDGVDSVPSGRWRRDPNSSPPANTPEQEQALRELAAIGYLSGSQLASSVGGVTRHDTERVSNGLNLVVSGHAPEAFLMDMAGETLHSWSCSIEEAWPKVDHDRYAEIHGERLDQFWRRAHVWDNGDLLAIFDGIGVIKLDKNSNILWSHENGAHHDVSEASDGRLFLLTRRAHVNASYNDQQPILEDYVTVLSAEGELLKEVSVLAAFENSAYSDLLMRLRRQGDILHTNTIELIERDDFGRDLPWQRGSVLLSILFMNTVCTLDLETESITWAEPNRWRLQHQPTILPSGNLLVFNNHAAPTSSGVIEFDPVARRDVWAYYGDADQPFWTDTCGSSQRLANGNTLVTESDPGRAFELTPQREIVWEYLNPHRAGDNDEFIATLFEIVRLDTDFDISWIPTPR